MENMTEEEAFALDGYYTNNLPKVDPAKARIRIPMVDDGSLEYLFNGYQDDGIREPVVDFGRAVGNEQLPSKKTPDTEHPGMVRGGRL